MNSDVLKLNNFYKVIHQKSDFASQTTIYYPLRIQSIQEHRKFLPSHLEVDVCSDIAPIDFILIHSRHSISIVYFNRVSYWWR